MNTVFAVVMVAAGAGETASSAPTQCSAAFEGLWVTAQVAGQDTLIVSYTVFNGSPDSVLWVKIGGGGGRVLPVIGGQVPEVVGAPEGWQGVVVFPEETGFVHVWWEPESRGLAIAPGDSLGGFTVRIPAPHTVPPGRHMEGSEVVPIDPTTVPYTVGGAAGRCYWGVVEQGA